ncbi:hypothetical protein [Ruegeria meonggei]|uniref:hypothetical protein n=1 Tax=Ruegeria meonggei TaxID=1446476 RepID=UPI00366FA384
MKITIIDQDDNGGSWFADRVWTLQDGSFTPPSPTGYLTTPQIDASGILMMHHPPGYIDDWHTAPAVVLGTILRGEVRIQTSDMDTRVLHVGDQFLACDLEGKGRRMSEISGGHYDLALVILNSAPSASAFSQ